MNEKNLKRPTPEHLKFIKEQETDIEDVFEWIANIFNISVHGKAKFSNNRKRLKLITGGWQGNEDIIDAMFENVRISICWRATIKGGVSIWDLREIVK